MPEKEPSPERVSAFPPIADYAFLADCEVTALIAPSSSVEWLCLPRLDSPSVFGSVLDRDAGGFWFAPTGLSEPADRRYIPGTLVLETSWGTPTGWVVVRDLLVMGPWHHGGDQSYTHRRAPTDYDADHVLLRTVKCVNGEVQFTLDCQPVLDYGRTPVHWEYGERGYHEGIATAEGNDLRLRLNTDMRLGFESGRAMARTLLKAGDTRFCALSWTEHEAPQSYDDAYERLVWTAHHWQHWLARGSFPDHRWSAYLQRSALTLKGLTFSPTGAVAAAATTSLPETMGGPRNWDYRYTWFRDSMFALTALYSLGFDWEANDFFWFIADTAERDGEHLQIMYGVDGERDLTEHVLDHLGGYENSKPVRIGNGAYEQRQHDLWGSVVSSIYLHARSREHGRLDGRAWKILRDQVSQALEHWQKPDQGIWEMRGEPRHFVSSKIMCWVAAHLGARMARFRDETELAQEWQAAAEQIKADVCERGVSGRGVFRQHYDTDALDASLLLIPILGFLPPDDPRVKATVLAIADELTEHGLVLRYRVEETDDGLNTEEGTFTICSFMLVSALCAIGEQKRAKDLCEKLLTMASPLGLYAEELDPHTGRHLGNFPQAFTHLALITAVLDVIGADRFGRPSTR
ncbi:MAG: glycoside hydrolase [Actinomycetia bacterium]|nr:glycoside hydrolase [Actinomycetes bacterium]MDQ1658285.1 alpha,alpha-trehalase [Cryptosporangiaceae bacterium]